MTENEPTTVSIDDMQEKHGYDAHKDNWGTRKRRDEKLIMSNEHILYCIYQLNRKVDRLHELILSKF